MVNGINNICAGLTVDDAGNAGLAIDESGGANVLRIGDTVIIPASFPQTAAILEREGLKTCRIDISELQKAESGVTCSSLIFQDKNFAESC